MPVFSDDTTLEQFNGFTAQSVDELESSGYTLVDICVDGSGSTDGFSKSMEKAVRDSLIALKGGLANGIKPYPKAD